MSSLGPNCAHIGAIFGLLWAVLAPTWAFLGLLWQRFALFWDHVRGLSSHPGANWSPLGSTSCLLERICYQLIRIWDQFEVTWRHLRTNLSTEIITSRCASMVSYSFRNIDLRATLKPIWAHFDTRTTWVNFSSLWALLDPTSSILGAASAYVGLSWPPPGLSYDHLGRNL